MSGRREAERKEAAERKEVAAERRQAKRQQQEQERQGIEFSPPPYEAPETLLERLGPGLGYLFLVLAGAFVLNLLVIVLIAGANGG